MPVHKHGDMFISFKDKEIVFGLGHRNQMTNGMESVTIRYT